MFRNVTSLRDVITLKIGCFRYKWKKQKPETSLRDVRRIKICCLNYVGKSKTFLQYNTIKAKI